MATIAKLNVMLDLDDSGFQRGLQNTRDKLDKWGSNLRSVGTKMTAGITAPLVGSGGIIVKWAADLEQTLGATEQLWGDNGAAIIKWSEGTNKSLGMTQNEALTSMNRFNGMLKQTGASLDETADMSQKLTERSADLSAMWGGSSIEASDALTSGLRGNYEALDKYNITLTESMVNEEAKAIAVADGREEITEADKVMARYNLIMEQSSDSQGQFSREADTTAGKLAIMRARVVDAATKFGKLLLPYVNKAADAFSKLVDWLENLNDTQRKWILGIAAVAAAMGPMLIIIGLLLPGISALIGLITFLLSPIGLVILVIAALVAGLVYAYVEFEAFRNIVDTVASTIKDVAIAAFEALLRAMEPVGDLVSTIVDIFGNLKSAVTAALSGDWSGAWESLKAAASSAVDAVWQYFTLLPGMILAALNIDAGSLMAKGSQWIQGLWDGATTKWTEFTAWVGGLAAEVGTWIGDTLTTIYQKGFDLISGFFQGAANRWQQFTVWAALLGSLAFTAVGDVIGTLVSKGSNIIQGFWDGATTKWTAMRTWFVNLPTMIFTAIGELWTTLAVKGSQIVQGFWTGAVAKWQDVKAWFTNLGYNIVVAVGSLANSLYNAGVAIMAGLKAGLVAGWEDVKNFLSGLNPAEWKGPEKRDKKMLYKPGIWIMQGLQHGLSEGWDDVTRQLSGYTPTISGGLSAGSAGIGGAPIVQIITLEPGKWQEFLADAQQGGKFARNFGSELGMMEGVG